MKTSKVFLLIFLILLSLCLVNTQPVKPQSSGTIYIRADGTVEGTDKIQRDGNVYTFTSNISDFVVVERENIVVDGAGYTLQGAGVTSQERSNTTGIDVSSKHDVTIKNMRITGFDTGIHIKNASGNIITENDITNNLDGIKISQSSTDNVISANNLTRADFTGILLLHLSKGNTLSENYIANNGGAGIYLSYYSSNNTISTNNIVNNSWGVIFSHFSTNNSMVRNLMENNTDGIYFRESSDNIFLHNTFLNNSKHVFDRAMLGFLCPPDPSINIWDNGIEGNYWDNYNGTDSDNDGIGDTSYLIYENNQDNYPLMEMRVREGVKFEPYVSTFHLLFEDKSHNLLGNLSGEIRITEPEKEIIHSICKLSLSSPRLDEYHEPYIHTVELITAWVFIIHRWGPIPIPIYPPDERKVTLHADEEIILFDHSDNVSDFEIEPRLVFWFSSGTKITHEWGSQILPTIRVYFSDGQEWKWEYEYKVTIPFMLWSGIEANLSELGGKIETETITFITVEKGHPIIITSARVIVLASIIVAIAVAAVFVRYRKRARSIFSCVW